MGEHKAVPPLTLAQIKAVMTTISAQVTDGTLDEDTADALRQQIIDAGLPAKTGEVTATRIEQFEKERKKRIQKNTERLKKFQRDFMRRKGEKLLAMDDDEWQALVDGANEDE